MLVQTKAPFVPVEHGNGQPTPLLVPAPKVEGAPSGLASRRVLKACVGVLVGVAVVSVGGYLLGARLSGGTLAADDKAKDAPLVGVTLVKGKPHTLAVPQDIRAVLGIRKANQELLAVAQPPTIMRPLMLAGSTSLDPTRLARIRARFAPARVVAIGQVYALSKSGQSELRELRPGDRVRKGDVLGIFYSVDVGAKKNDLLDALIQLELDQKILDEAEKHREAVPEVFMLNALRAVQGDRNAINRALNNLKVWDIPQDEIDALHVEAKKISADKNAWFKTPEGRWVTGDKQEKRAKGGSDGERENPWGRVTLRAPFDGIIVERNLHLDEMVVDNTVNLFQVADVRRLLVIANAPEDELPTLEALDPGDRRWNVQTVGASSAAGLSGPIDEIGYLIDPYQHTAVIKGYVDNPGQRLRAGQYVSATVSIPPPSGVVEIPIDALVDDGKQSVVFVQEDPAKHQYTMRRVQVTHRFEQKVFVRSVPIPKNDQLTEQEAEEGLLPKAPLLPGERVLQSGGVELKSALLSLQSQSQTGLRKD
jgi:cobalt-zinc-cadmium efflux system membrane fusion protein